MAVIALLQDFALFSCHPPLTGWIVLLPVLARPVVDFLVLMLSVSGVDVALVDRLGGVFSTGHKLDSFPRKKWRRWGVWRSVRKGEVQRRWRERE